MKIANIKNTIVILLLISAVCMALLSPVRDNDFFWHLATGRWIAEHGELPAADPFAYTTSLKAQEEFYRAKIILTQYWLANLLQYGIFSLAGFKGIIGLRVLVMVLTFLVIGVHMRRKGLGVMPVMLLLLPLFYVLMNYTGDRPNQMTFLFLALFMYLADAMKQGEKKGYLLPLVFVVWANMHGGFLLGAAIAVFMVAAELIRKIAGKDHMLNKRMISIMLATLAAGFLNPNGYTMAYSMLTESSSYYNATITEAMTPLQHAGLGSSRYMSMLGTALIAALFYFAFRLYTDSSGPKEKILRICDELLIVFCIAGLSFTAVRYIPLLVLVLLPMIAPLFAGRVQDLLNTLSRYLIPELLVSVVSLWLIYSSYPETVLKHPLVDSFFPDDAVEFIRKNEIKGRFYNYYDWGGYLIWEFYPEQFVFIDGRAISIKAFHAFNAIVKGKKDALMGKPLYQSLLDSYSVRNIMIPAVRMQGDMLEVVRPLEQDPEWRLVFVGRNSLIYSRDQIGQEYPKSYSYLLALSSALDLMRRAPDNRSAYLTFAKANSYLGRSQSAIAGLEAAMQKRPALRGGSLELTLKLLKEGKEIPIELY